MDGMTFGVELAKALAWPMLVAGCVIGFRRHVGTLVITGVRVLRQARRMKWGQFELEAVEQVAEAAVQAKTTEVERIQQRLASDEQIQPDERRHLVEQLKDAAAENGQLRSLLHRLQSARQSADHAGNFVASISRYNGRLSPGRTEILRAMAEIIGPAWIIEQSKNRKTEALRQALTRVAVEVRQGSHFDRSLNGGALAGLASAGLLDESCAATEVGVVELVRVAYEILGSSRT